MLTTCFRDRSFAFAGYAICHASFRRCRSGLGLDLPGKSHQVGQANVYEHALQGPISSRIFIRIVLLLSLL